MSDNEKVIRFISSGEVHGEPETLARLLRDWHRRTGSSLYALAWLLLAMKPHMKGLPASVIEAYNIASCAMVNGALDAMDDRPCRTGVNR